MTSTAHLYHDFGRVVNTEREQITLKPPASCYLYYCDYAGVWHRIGQVRRFDATTAPNATRTMTMQPP